MKMKTDYYEDPYVQTMISNMPEKTGDSLEGWFSKLKVNKLSSHKAIMSFLKDEHGMTHGYANTISLLFRQKAEGGPPTHEELVEAQYEKKQDLRPIYEHLLKEVKAFGDDVEVAPKKSYVSMRRGKQFAIIQPSTKTRMDLGLNLDSEQPSTGCLNKGDKWSGMCTHTIEISSVDEVTPEVIDWMRKAYQGAA
jgi:predicted transport protein